MKFNEAFEWRPINTRTADEKIEAFDKLWMMAFNHLHDIQVAAMTDKYCNCTASDGKEQLYETIMNLLGREVWKVINTLIG